MKVCKFTFPFWLPLQFKTTFHFGESGSTPDLKHQELDVFSVHFYFSLWKHYTFYNEQLVSGSLWLHTSNGRHAEVSFQSSTELGLKNSSFLSRQLMVRPHVINASL